MDDSGLRLGGLVLLVAGVALPLGQLLGQDSVSAWWLAATVVSGVYAIASGALCFVVRARSAEQRAALVPVLKAWPYGASACIVLMVLAMLMSPAKSLPWLTTLAVLAACVAAVVVTLAQFRITAKPQEA